jgi:chemotaxis protein MotB
MTREGVVVDINAGVLFQTGEAVLEKSAIDVMKAVAGKLAGISNKIKIEGHTDSIPITTAMYPSNWELSSARASSVARLFIENGVNASRMTVIGFADQKPVSSNESEAGRSRNRRVTVSVTTETGS